jgi:ribosome-associated protein
LEQLSILTTRRKRSSAGRITKNSKFFKSIINAIQEKKGENIIALDLRKIPEAVADFFIICEASSTTHVKAIADFIEFHTKKTVKEIPYRIEGQHSGQWILVDYINIVVHIMLPETRKFYKLEEMWSDGVAEEHNS